MNMQLVFEALYDGDGRRIETVAGDTSIYHYQAGSWDPAYVKDLTTGLSTNIIFAAGLRIGKVQGGVSSFYHLDRLGSVRLETQAASQQAFSAKYLPYGNTYATSGAEAFQFTGKQLDVATGLSYYGYRYYDDQIGRFLTQDKGKSNLFTPQTLDRYSYVINNPNVYTDPDGLAIGDEFGFGCGPSGLSYDLFELGNEILRALGLPAFHDPFRSWCEGPFKDNERNYNEKHSQTDRSQLEHIKISAGVSGWY